ncbi:GTPase HflX [Ruminiclostridium herbifermentans]|uniref:GTPase HflX n=1 Tax=Ruminiclostridium herbifermentans TaxID=2488810 RepID=A0A4U7JGT2_9FIRM|nr:GTPase HflX [Ruminiclostridium herbifermentans]QNU68689.1 GTPase HflX [Ruminiclostridium herbifermentans]
MKINGNTQSIKDRLLNELEGLYDVKYGPRELVPVELAQTISRISYEINREISVLINRKGTVVDISIGDSGKATLPQMDNRRGNTRLSAIRCIHTHPGGKGLLSQVDIKTLQKLRLDAMIALGILDGQITEIYVGCLNIEQEADVYGPFTIGDTRLNYFYKIIEELDTSARTDIYGNEEEAEKAVLVGLETSNSRIEGMSLREAQNSLDELEELAKTAGAIVIDKIIQRKQNQDSAYYVGKGKIEELALMCQATDVQLLIFDDELSGAQIRNIEELTGARVIDRTTLILDIFAQRAKSKEGKLQVELAQLKYKLPRLIGLGNELSRLGGGIGTRGPGEKKLEVDRRHIRRRISSLERELKLLEKRRIFMREGREKNNTPVIALVGYTNAGKSTLMNRLCGSSVFVEDKLFATLDPSARKLILADGREAVLIDTVGFIRKLPHDLIEAFKSTLEEAVHADMLLHVVDASNENAAMQISVVEGLLEDLGATTKHTILVLNKQDIAASGGRINSMGYTSVCEISAVTGYGIPQLLEKITEGFKERLREINLLIPYNVGWVIPYIYENGKVLGQEYQEEGISVKAVVKVDKISRLNDFILV